ncbi:Hypothetical predicted protein [Cloeon dipterum]|uniref:Serine/threonine-protein kinase ATR n=1 Tax=Cloeon dipterum TaxID=197152 RepID=A0A8S1CRL1_9INSE|nr:Hypothetical predicted protein [Cloeon dipterum]
MNIVYAGGIFVGTANCGFKARLTNHNISSASDSTFNTWNSSMAEENRSSSPSDEVSSYWKAIIEMMRIFIQHPKRIKSKFRVSFNQIFVNLEEKSNLFCPTPSCNTENAVQDYQNFLDTMTNCFLILLTKDLDYTKVPDISHFYEKLLKLVYFNCGDLFKSLMNNLMSTLMMILDVYVNPVGFYPPITVGTFCANSASEFPSDCRTAVRIGSLESANPVVSFLTDVIFSSYQLALQSPLREQTWQLLLKRLEAWSIFKYSDLFTKDLLASFPFHEKVACIPLLTASCSEIVQASKSGKDDDDLMKLQNQVAQIFLRPNFPIQELANLPFPGKLKGTVMNNCCVQLNANQSSLVKLLCTLLSNHVIHLSDIEIKWLAHKFNANSMVPGFLLLAYMEAELKIGSSNFEANNFEHSPVKSSAKNFKHAEDFSRVWQILQSIFLKMLDKIAQMEDQDLTDTFNGIEKLHMVLNGLQVSICSVDKKQKRVIAHASFCFFPLHLGKIVAQMGVLPRHCIENTALDSKTPPKVTSQRILTAWGQILDMLNVLRHLPESSKLEPADLSSIEILCGLPWLRNEPDLNLTQYKLEWYQLIAASVQKQLKVGEDNDFGHEFLALFVKAFNNTKFRPSAWRVQVVLNNLSTLPGDHMVIMLQAIPVLISTCQRDDIEPLYAAFKKIQSVHDVRVSRAAAGILPSVVCALSGGCEVQESIIEGEFISTTKILVRICCPECTKSVISSRPRGWNFLNGKFTEDWKQMIEHKDDNVRRALCSGFPQIVQHLGKTFSLQDIETWLQLLTDDDSLIATDFALNLPTLLNLKNNSVTKEEITTMIITSLHSLIETTWKKKKDWNTVLCAVDPLLRIELDSLVKPIMMIVVKLVALRKEDVCGLNQAVLLEYVSINLVNPMVLFFQSQDDIWSVVIDTLAEQDPSERSAVYCFQRISNIFNIRPDVLKKHLFHFLQILIPRCFVDSNFLYILTETAVYLNVSQQTMLKKWHTMLYPMLLVKHPDCLDFYLNLADCNDDIDRYLTLIVIQVIINCSSSSKQIVDKLSNILKDSEDNPGLSPDEVSQHLQNHMLGILDTIQGNVLNKYASADLKLRSLLGFTNMISFMSKEAVTQFYSKILDVICTFKALEEQSLVKAYCSLILTFLHRLENDKIGPVMFTVLTNVTFLNLQQFRSEAKAIVGFFVTTNKEQIRQNAQDLFNFTELLEELNFNRILKSCQEAFDAMDYEDILEGKLLAISNNYVESRILALKVLKNFLVETQPKVQEFLFSHRRESTNLNSIFGKLIAGASSSNSGLRVPSIECLSELGAIDPSHWIVAFGFKDSANFFIDSSCASFVCKALETLLDGFQSSTKKADMDVIGYVCQEFMKANDFQDEPAKAPVQIWNRFSDQTKSMLMPFFTSTYICKKAIEASELPHPLANSQYAGTFEDWIFHWVVRLISFIKNKCIRDTFDALKLVFRIDLKNIHFFLPHIFTHAVWAASAEEIDMIVEEMLAAAHMHEQVGKLKEEESFEIIFRALEQNFDMQSFVELESVASNLTQNEMSLKCSKLIFFLIDYIIHWNLEFEQAPQGSSSAKSRTSRASICSEASFLSNSTLAYKYRINKKFIARFNMKVSAEQNHACNENFRALRHLDMHCLNRTENVEDCLSLFLRVHSQLQNSDFVNGVSSLRTGATAKSEQLLLNEMSGQFQESIVWYEKMLHSRQGDPHDILCYMIKAYLQLEQYQSVLGIYQKHHSETNCSKFNGSLTANKLEAHWRTGEWEKLHLTLEDAGECDLTWAFYFAKILDSIFQSAFGEAKRNIVVMRDALGSWLNQCGANSSPYAANYAAFLLMHLLTDVEIVVKLLHPSEQLGSLSCRNQVTKIKAALEMMELRQKRISFSWKGLQLVLSVRRTLLSLLQHTLAGFAETDSFIKKQLGQLWIDSARVSMNHRQFPQALGYLISSEQCGLKETFVLQAQLEWERGAKELALIYLHRGINKHFPDRRNFRPGMESDGQQAICGKAMLLIAEYSYKMKIVDARQSLVLYKAAVNCYSQSEEAWIHFARMWDVVKTSKDLISGEEKSLNALKEIVRCYCNALTYGVKHVYESLPRVITIWANTGTKLYEVISKGENDKQTAAKKTLLLNAFNVFQDHMRTMKKKLPPYAFYVCFNSLSSRLCNPYKPVYTFIQEIFVGLLQAHPYQMLWKLIPMIKVSHTVRVNRVQETLLKFGEKNNEMNKLMDNYVNLNSFLYDLGHLQIKSASSRVRMSNIAPKLVEFFREPKGIKILMPTDELMSVVLPEESADFKNYNAFPREPVFITGVLELVTIITSLQKPKKFTFSGSDGLEYSWLLKNKDDLRIDSTVMHFMQALNALLDQCTECKERRLSCRTYSVVPLGEDCGLIEFVPNLTTMRQVIMTLYQGKGEKCDAKEELKKNYTIETKRRIFENALIPAHPPVLSDWFHWKFPDHSAWNEARKRFIYSSAVMSVVGYILGLGDRHGGNITLDNATGESIHVDYNCIFNKVVYPVLVVMCQHYYLI